MPIKYQFKKLNRSFTKVKRGKNLLSYLLLGVLAVFMLFPLLWLISTALKSPTEDIFGFPPPLLPKHPTLANFFTVWATNPFGRYLLNSTIVASLSVLLNLVFCALAAYPLARLNFRGREIIFALTVSTIMIPFQIIMIPLYIVTIKLGLRNTYVGMILPNIASAFGIFLLRQAFQGVPKELEEAARIDGCSELGLWWYIMLPAVRPALVTLAIFVFIGTWGDFLWPTIVIDQPEYYTLALGVAFLAGSFSLDWRLVAAGSLISIIPVLLVFVFLQKYIFSTEISTGIKG